MTSQATSLISYRGSSVDTSYVSVASTVKLNLMSSTIVMPPAPSPSMALRPSPPASVPRLTPTVMMAIATLSLTTSPV